jgi:hypothetical protein
LLSLAIEPIACTPRPPDRATGPAKALVKVHKLRGDVSLLEGSGGNIAVLTGSDGKVFLDAGILG